MLLSKELEWRHLRYFVAVATELNFRKAAESLYISQPGLSRQIKQLEDVLGVALFERSTRKVTLTAAGSYLKTEVGFIGNHMESVVQQLKQIAQGNLGELRIGFLGSAMQNIIPELLLKLQELHPGIQTALTEMSNRAQLDQLLHDKLDLGFVRMARVPADLEMRPVFEDTFSLVVPKGQGRKPFKTLNQFQDTGFILFAQEYSPYYYDTVMSICENAGFTPKVAHKSVHAQTIFTLVANGMGVAIVPTSFQEGFKLNVDFIPLNQLPQRAVLSAVWKKSNRSPVLKHGLELLFGEGKV